MYVYLCVYMYAWMYVYVVVHLVIFWLYRLRSSPPSWFKIFQQIYRGTDSFIQFKAKNYVDQEAAELLGANFLLKGNIRKKRDKLRVNIELVDGTDGSIIWADGIEKSEIP